MGKLADQANDLRKRLSLPFFELPTKEEFSHQVGDQGDSQTVEREMRFREEELSKAVEQISDYLLSWNHTVTIASLNNRENMLIHFYRAHKMAQLMQKRPPFP